LAEKRRVFEKKLISDWQISWRVFLEIAALCSQ
jgi:hypothetical protein